MIARLPWKRGDCVGVYYVRGKCKECKQDCFAYRFGHCEILNKCDFGERSCPFYKSQTDYEQGLKDYPETVFTGKDKKTW